MAPGPADGRADGPPVAGPLDDVEQARPARLVPALLTRVRSSGHPPLIVLDPGWPASLRVRALDEVRGAVARGLLTSDDLVLFTSGSSGSPRAVVRTVESWRASLRPLTDVTGIGAPADDPGPVWVPGPLTSSLALYGALHAAWADLPWVAGRADAGPAQEATAAHLVPTQLRDALDARDHGLLPRLRTAVVAGARLPPSLRDRATAHGIRVIEYYGAAELSFVGWRDDDGPFRAFPRVDVRVGEGSAAGPLWVRSPYVARAYLRPGADAPWQQRDDWHTVGDLAEPSGTGWRLLGRGDLAVTTGGHTVVTAEVEVVLRRVPGVADVVVLGVPHERLGQVVAAVVQPTADHDDGLRERLDRAVATLPAPARPRRWWRTDAWPLLPSGKVDRSRLGLVVDTLPRLR
jgi:acyl-CoA synthetase (AMP-forming)/AMP-acid ligase II